MFKNHNQISAASNQTSQLTEYISTHTICPPNNISFCNLGYQIKYKCFQITEIDRCCLKSILIQYMTALEIQIRNLIRAISQRNYASAPEVVGINYKLNNEKTMIITYAIIKWYGMLGQYTIPSITE
jgi:hypothetical protein